jgi:FkbM family methyltransferase
VSHWSAERRVETLAQLLRHPDPSQLLFQITEIADEQTYLRCGVTVERGDVVLDVGANVGVAAAFFAVICEAGQVHCFEPVEPVFELLRQNVGQLPACVLHPEGLYSKAGRAPITYYPRADAMSGLYADPRRDQELVRTVLLNHGFSAQEADEQVAGRYEQPQILSCELRTLSSFLQEEKLLRVDLLKIDVERAELDVLAGIDEPDWPKIKQLVMEIHDENGRGEAIEAALASRGFRVTCDQEATMRGTSTRMMYAIRQ